MPRVAKPRTTQTGQPAQPIGAVAGQEYGMGQAQMDLQRQLPAPNVQAPSNVPPPALQAATPPSVAGQPAPGQPTPEQAPPDVMAIAKAMPGGPGLFASGGSGQITRGLASGPGPGPEILGMPTAVSPLAETLRNLTKWTGDSYFAELMRKNGLG